MSGHCKHCGYDHCQCDEIEKDLRRIEKQGFIMSDTPRTDEQINGKPCTRFSVMAGDSLRDAFVPSEFTRTLERELTAARQEIERLQTNGIHSCHDQCRRPNCVLRRELKAATEQRDRLAEALDYSTGVITALGEIEPDIYDLSIDARNKRTGEEYKLSIIDVI